MQTREIWHEIMINVTPAQLYACVSQASNIAHWWTTGARGETVVGGSLEFWFADYLGSVAEITALEEGSIVRWKVTGGKVRDWIGTEIEFRIFVQDGRTMLHFRHSGWRHDAPHFAHCSLGWAIFLLSLKEFAETGKGRPYPYDLPINMWTPPAAA